MEWLGHAKISFTHALSPRAIRNKDGKETNILSICESATPPCCLNPFLYNGHLQTLWAVTKPAGPKIYYKRKDFVSEHEVHRGTYAVDFVVRPFEVEDPELSRRTIYYTKEELQHLGSTDHRPMLVVMHGLAGGSHEIYLRQTIAPMVGAGGWEACIVNSRGCARSKITSGLLFSARATWDIRQTVKWLQTTFPNRPLFGLGFSLGGTALTNYCGEEGMRCALKGAVVCSSPFDLEVASKFLQSSYIGKEVYLRVMGTAMKGLAQRHRKAIEEHTDIDVDALLRVTYLTDFDRLTQCPIWGYPTETAYYRDASSADSILSIEIPFLAIHSTDDPIAVKQSIPYGEFQQNPSTILLTTSLGGHLCWFELGTGERWFTKPIANFLNYLAFNAQLSSLKPQGDGAKAQSDSELGYYPMRRKMVIFQDSSIPLH